MIFGPDGEELCGLKKYLGYKSNNQAEYLSLILGLNLAIGLGIERLVTIGDSELVISQVTGRYSVRKYELKKLHDIVLKLSEKFKEINYLQLPREMNKRADKLSKDALQLHV